MLAGGLVCLVIGVFLLLSFLAFLGLLLLVIGVVLLILGAVLREGSAAAIPAPHFQALLARLYQVELRQIATEQRLARIEEKVGLAQAEPMFPAVPQPLFPPPPGPSPGLEPPSRPAAAPPAPTPSPSPAAPPPASRPPTPEKTAPPGVSRLELELGEKWFQRIGLVVLVIAFAFLLAIVLPRLRPEEIVGADFAAAIGLALLGEFVYARKQLGEYAKGLEAGAFGIAYIGVWGGGFYLRLPGFPWPYLLGVVLALHAAAALRYRSPFLSVEAGLVYIGWAVWLRAFGYLSPLDLALLLSVGGLGVLGLVYVQRSELSALSLTFAFDIVSLAAFDLLVPYGYLPVLSVGLLTAAVVALLRLERVLPVRTEARLAAWAAGLGLTYGVLIANSFPIRRGGGIDDLTIFATFVTLTAALTASEVLSKDRRLNLPFAVLVGVLSLPVPFLMGRGEVALAVYPAVLLSLALLCRTEGLAWLTNLVYLSVIAFAAVGLRDPVPQFAAVWGLFFGVAALHAFLQVRSGYRTSWGLPTDLQVLLYAVTLVGLTTRAFPGSTGLVLYGAALPAALLLNRRALRSAIPAAAAVLVLGASMALARWWALEPSATGYYGPNAALLAGYHVAFALAIGAWIAYARLRADPWKVAQGIEARVSWPALALLAPLLAQDLDTADLFLTVPLAVTAIAFYLDDPVAFSAGYIALAAQSYLAASLSLQARAVLLLPVFPAALVVLGCLLEVASHRRAIGRTSEFVGTASWFVVAPLAFGLRVETTIAWAAAGGVAVAWGLWRRFAPLRYAGFVLFFVVLGKVFLYDIAGLSIELRILGLIVVATSLLLISYGYARYRRRTSPAG